MDQFSNAQTPGSQASGGLPPSQQTWQSGPVPPGTPPVAPGWGAPQGTQGWQGGQQAPPPPAPGYSGVLSSASFVPNVIGKTTKWTALPAIALWFKILAWIGLVGGALGFLIALIVGFSLSATFGGGAAGLSFVYALFLLGTAAVGFLYNLAASELIGVFLAIEKNTRKE